MDVLLGDNDVGGSLSCALHAQTQLFGEVVIGTSTKTSLAPAWLLSSSGLCFFLSALNSAADRLPFLNNCLGIESTLPMHVSSAHTSSASFSHRGFPLLSAHQYIFRKR